LFSRVLLSLMLLFVLSSIHQAESGSVREPKNSWRGITPLQSSPEDVARVLGFEPEGTDPASSGPHRVDGGEVSFNYLTPGLARIYKAPRSVVGKVFTIYFKPSEQATRETVKLAPGFRRCTESMTTTYYYLVNDAGIAYEFRRAGNQLETVIYQPTRAQVRNLGVNTECVF
jgi:hypothetical protein